MVEVAELELVVGGIIGILGLVYGWIQAGTVRDLVGAAKTFAQMSACHLKITADGDVTTEESAELGNLTVTFLEELETIAGIPVYNDKSVALPLPKQ